MTVRKWPCVEIATQATASARSSPRSHRLGSDSLFAVASRHTLPLRTAHHRPCAHRCPAAMLTHNVYARAASFSRHPTRHRAVKVRAGKAAASAGTGLSLLRTETGGDWHRGLIL